VLSLPSLSLDFVGCALKRNRSLSRLQSMRRTSQAYFSILEAPHMIFLEVVLRESGLWLGRYGILKAEQQEV
jgi:hypothetical protein